MTRDEAVERLSAHRKEIDHIDRQILHWLNERTKVVEQIGRVKQEVTMPIYEPKREDEVYRNITESNGGPMPQDAVRRVFERIIDEMRSVQRNRMKADEQKQADRKDT